MPLTESFTLNTGAKMPKLGLGTWQAAEGESVENAVRWALDLGYRHVDTAAVYKNEQGVGKALRASGVPRGEVFVTTKLANADARAGNVRAAFDASLDKLGLEYVDLYLLHWPVGDYKANWAALEDLHASGRARAIGVSNFMEEHLADLATTARVTPAVDQVEFSPYLVQTALLDACRQRGVQHEGWTPLAGGRVFKEKALRELAKKRGKTVSQIVLRWNVQQGSVAIPKSVNRERLAENRAIFDFELSAEEMRAVSALDEGKRVGPDPRGEIKF